LRRAPCPRRQDELAQVSNGRNALRLAVARWNTVLATVKTELQGLPEVHKTARKLSGLLDSMLQHSKAIDELQRLSLLDPVARVHSQVNTLGVTVKSRVVAALLKTHGGAALSQQEEAERLEICKTLLAALDSPQERLALLQAVASKAVPAGAMPGMIGGLVGGLIGTLPADEASSFLCEQLSRHAATLRSEAERETFRDALMASLAKPPGRRDSSASGGVLRGSIAETQTASQDGGGLRAVIQAGRERTASSSAQAPFLPQHGAHAEMLASIAAEVGPETSAALPRAMRELD